jgi:hypothetical protein
MTRYLKLAVSRAILLAMSGGCGDDGSMSGDGALGDGSGGPDPAELACDEVAEPGTPIAAVEARDATAPEVTIGAEPYLVSLPAGGTGYVRLVTDEPETLAILFFRSTGVLSALYFDDADFAFDVTSAGEDTFCPSDIPEHFDIDLEDPGTYYLELTAASDAWLFVAGGVGHGHME